MRKTIQSIILCILSATTVSATAFGLTKYTSAAEDVANTQHTSNVQPIAPDAPDEPLETIPFEVESIPQMLAPVIEEAVVIEVEPEEELPLTDEEIDLIALVTMAEAEGESEEGKRLVIDTILNRMDSEYFPNTVAEVIFEPYAFTSMWNGRVDVCTVQEDIRQLVIEELDNRLDYDCVFFHAGRYSKYGTPMYSVGNHYFSSLK